MGTPLLSDIEFITKFQKIGPAELHKEIGTALSDIFKRRKRLEAKHKITIDPPKPSLSRRIARPAEYPHRAYVECINGHVIVAGDAHYWPGPAPIMHRALVRFCKELKPKIVIFNGDVIDAPTISRHPPIGWENQPTLADEIDNAKERLHEVERATFKAEKLWNGGNHDLRFETRIATIAPEYAKIHGVHLHDHFALWRTAWSTWINNEIVIKHRFRSGAHAPYNNTIYAGKTMITGHLHSAKVTPFTDYNGTRYGVDAGCIADTNHKAFVDYTEDSPLNWRSAFCVLTFVDGHLLQPELVLKFDDTRVEFRGELITP